MNKRVCVRAAFTNLKCTKSSVEMRLFMLKLTVPDYHFHTCFSGDSEASVHDMLNSAVNLGLKEICITDHLDYHYPDTPAYFLFDIDEYFSVLSNIKESYRGKLDVRIGVEFGLQPDLGEKLSQISSRYPFDFIIGSSHVVQHIDPYYPKYWESKTIEEGISQYFYTIIENLKTCKDFDVYGHLDYIIRYAPVPALEYSFDTYQPLLDKCLKALIENGIGIEMNTSGFKYGLNQPHPSVDILKRYREFGGEIITLGSDAHSPEHIAYAFDKAIKILKDCGYSYIAAYKNRKPEFIPI